MGNPGALMIQQAREEDQGKYECVARNSLGVVHSKAAHLYVKGKCKDQIRAKWVPMAGSKFM
ncbi:hypothetical protein COOONC_28661 [Cooperia oncophora]